MLPLSRPVLSTIAVLTIVTSWNAFFLPLLVLTDPDTITLPIVSTTLDAVLHRFAQVLAFTTLVDGAGAVLLRVRNARSSSGLTAGAVKE